MILASLKEISADLTAFIFKEMAGDKNGREFSNMKTYTEATTLAIQNDAPIQSSQASFEVCMHVLGPTRTDADRTGKMGAQFLLVVMILGAVIV